MERMEGRYVPHLVAEMENELSRGPDIAATVRLLDLLGLPVDPRLLDEGRLYAEYLPVPPGAAPLSTCERHLSLLWEALDRSALSPLVNIAFPFRRMIAERLFGRCGRGFIACEHVRFNFGRRIEAGDALFINMGAFIDAKGGVSIGDRVGLAEHVRIFTHAHGEADHAERSYAPVTIGDDVKIGAGATVLPGVEIGEGALVAAGAVVTRDVPAGMVVSGMPARVVRERRSDGRKGLELRHIWLADGAFQD
ncbi:MAG TPA: acyltransferase [Methanoregulaceae archaeon]|nr:acyltransferase [Methanoregulaceae archaeon]